MNQPSTTPNIKRMHDGWVFDTEIFDDEVEESEDKEQDYADKWPYQKADSDTPGEQ